MHTYTPDRTMKRILIASPYFAPENSVAAIRFTKIAKYLSKMGYDITIICSQMDAHMTIDKTLEKDLNRLKKITRINYPNLLYYKIKGKFGVEKPKDIHKNAAVPSEKVKPSNKNKNKLVWAYVHFCSYILGKKYIKNIKKVNEKFDVVITTFSPISAHMLGSYMKKKGLCSVWIADFRDPITLLGEKSAVDYLVQRYMVKLVDKADYITTVSNGCASKLICEAKEFEKNIKDKIRVISNGYDSDDRKDLIDIKTDEENLVFSYCGSFYQIGGTVKNDISPLFLSLKDLVDQGKINSSKIRIKYAGRDAALFNSFAMKFDMQGVVEYCGRISRDESLCLQRSSDVVIVPIWNNKNENGIISGKFFETLLVQRNALIIVTGDQAGSELSHLVNQMNCGFVYEEINGNQDGIGNLKDWICTIYNDKMQHKELKYKNDFKKEPYSHQELAKKFEELF